MFKTGHESLQTCLLLDVVGEIVTEQSDTLQLFYIPIGHNQLSEKNSVLVSLEPKELQQFHIRLFSPTGFMDYFRLDPVTQAGSVILKNLEFNCRF